ncbi:MAG: hypothetical protein JKX85_10485 [Phycisphaeraceae bacterium]|nr:hypothetical protein [Phycisphaeraceae bacterium]
MAGRPPYVGYFYFETINQQFGLINLHDIETGVLARAINLMKAQQAIADSYGGTVIGRFVDGSITMGNQMNAYVVFAMAVDVAGVIQTIGVLADVSINGHLNWWITADVWESSGVVGNISSVEPVILSNGDVSYGYKIYSRNGVERDAYAGFRIGDAGNKEIYTFDNSIYVQSFATYPLTALATILVGSYFSFSYAFRSPFFPNPATQTFLFAWNESMTSTTSDYLVSRVGYGVIDLVTRVLTFTTVHLSLSLRHQTYCAGGAYPLGNGYVFIYIRSAINGSAYIVYADDQGFVETSYYRPQAYYMRGNSLFFIWYSSPNWIIKRVDLSFDETTRTLIKTEIWSVTLTNYIIKRMTAG